MQTNQNQNAQSPAPTPLDQLANARTIMRSDLQIGRTGIGDRRSGIIEDRLRGKYFEVGPKEHAILEKFDGNVTNREIAHQLANQPGENAESHLPAVLSVAQWCVQNNLASIQGGDQSSRIATQSRQIRSQQLLSRLNLLSLRIPLLNPDRFLQRFDRIAEYLFHPLAFTVWLLTAIYACASILADWPRFSAAYEGIFSGNRWMWLIVVWVALKVIHEMGHGLACRKFGGEAREAGILLLLFAPLAYIDVSSCWKFHSKWKKIAVGAAGMYFELFVAFAAAIAWSRMDSDGVLSDLCFQTVLMASVTTVLFNANPLMKFDGYFILSDATGLHNLYTRGQTAVQNQVKWLILGITIRPQSVGSRTERSLVAIYGWLSLIWRLIIGFSLLIASSVMFHGAGILLALIAAGLWYGLPVMKVIRQSVQLLDPQFAKTSGLNRKRAIAGVLATSSLAPGFLFFLQSPASRSAPAVVQFVDESNLRAVESGFIDAVHCIDGEFVEAGQLLVEIRNDDLATTIRELELEFESCRTRARSMLQKKELAMWQSENERSIEIENQLAEHRSTMNALKLVAPFSGTVCCRDIESLQGRYIERGAVVVTVAKSDGIEIVASIGQESSASMDRFSEKPVRAVFRGAPVTLCTVKRVDPQATTKPFHPAFCATNGGPFPVRNRAHNELSSGETTEELLSPCIDIQLAMPVELRQTLRPGQTGRIVFTSDQYSLGAWLWISANRWVREKVQLAEGSR